MKQTINPIVIMQNIIVILIDETRSLVPSVLLCSIFCWLFMLSVEAVGRSSFVELVIAESIDALIVGIGMAMFGLLSTIWSFPNS